MQLKLCFYSVKQNITVNAFVTWYPTLFWEAQRKTMPRLEAWRKNRLVPVLVMDVHKLNLFLLIFKIDQSPLVSSCQSPVVSYDC